MRFRHMEIFFAVMRTGSLSRAAQLLCISQPAASKVLAHAELDLGFKLFTRAHGRLVPTRESELLYVDTSHLFSSLENVQRLARNLKLNPEGHLRIGCLPSLGLSLIPQSVQEFRKVCASVSLDIETRHGDELMTQVLSRDLDLAVVFDPPARPGIAVTELGRVAIVYLGPPRADDGNGVSLSSLGEEQWIGVGENHPIGDTIDRALGDLELSTRRTPSIGARTYYVAAALAERGLGYALIDEHSAQFALRNTSNPLMMCQLNPTLSVGISVISPEGVTSSYAFDTFISALKHSLTNLSVRP